MATMAAMGYGARVAVVGAGVAGLACARELRRWGLVPVVFEAGAAVGGRCGAVDSALGTFDHGAQMLDAGFEHVSLVPQPRSGLSTLHPWSMAARDERDDDDDENAAPGLNTLGLVGVPSMAALPQALARSIDVRLRSPIRACSQRDGRWVLHDGVREIDEHFAALVLALPAPLARPLLAAAPSLAAALGSVTYRPRWVLLLGTQRQTGLPLYREYPGSPLERVVAMHAKPGRATPGRHERWFIQADAHWSALHAALDDISISDLMLANLRELAGRDLHPTYLAAHHWPLAYAAGQPAAAQVGDCLWDDAARVGVCGDSVVESRLDRVFDSGIALARRVVAEVHQAERSTRFGLSALGVVAAAANDVRLDGASDAADATVWRAAG